MMPNEYQQLALKTEQTPPFVNPPQMGDESPHPREVKSFARLMHGAIGMCTEVGELQDMLKKHLIYKKPFDRTNVLEECGDVLWYVALALDACGLTMEEAMERNIAKLKVRFGDKFREDAAVNRDLVAERKALESSEGCTFLTPSGLKYEDLKVGTGAAPEEGKKVTVHYTGTLPDGKKFDSSIDRGHPFSFTIGCGQVIKGWDEGVMSMKVGGKRKLLIPAALAYGNRAVGGIIPANSDLHFDVELLGVG